MLQPPPSFPSSSRETLELWLTSCWRSAAAPWLLRMLFEIPEQLFTQGWDYISTSSGHGQLV